MDNFERRLERIEERMERGFAEVREDISSLFRDGPITKLSERLMACETQVKEHLDSTRTLKRWALGILGTLATSGIVYAAAKIAGM